MRYLRGATALTPSRSIPNSAALIDGERLAALGSPAEVPCPNQAEVVEADGLLLAPGFIDLQLNGAFGHDFTAEPTSIWAVAARLPQYGVTAFLPTLITSPPAAIAAAQAVLRAGPPPGFGGALPLGLHLEGPFLNPEKRGAHNPAHLRPPDLESITDWSPQNGVRLVTLAPELPGALDVIRALCERGVVVGAGHSLADYAAARAGLEAGLTYGTHLFNAMPPVQHRAPGLVEALLTDPRATVGLIADGVHLHPALVKLIWQSAGPERVNVVTDAMAGLGKPPGRYPLGEFEVTVSDHHARLSDGRLAGSILSLDRAVRNLIAFTGCSVADALRTVSETPARVLGLSDRGRLAPGCRADLVLLTDDLRVAATFVGGVCVYAAPAGS
jgi:N-acetylglucosamine-6-phosphate deacetylase